MNEEVRKARNPWGLVIFGVIIGLVLALVMFGVGYQLDKNAQWEAVYETQTVLPHSMTAFVPSQTAQAAKVFALQTDQAVVGATVHAIEMATVIQRAVETAVPIARTATAQAKTTTATPEGG